MPPAQPTPEDLDRYAEASTTASPDHLQRLEDETRASLTAPQMLSGAVVGRLLETLVWLRRPRLVLEIGTYSGGSALWMARALPDGGRIVSCELDPERAAFAEDQIARAGMSDRVQVRRGPALETIRALDEPWTSSSSTRTRRAIRPTTRRWSPAWAPRASSSRTTP
jgi:caffeoyl-CoA O-methyltransferase